MVTMEFRRENSVYIVHCLCAWASNDGRIWRMYLNISVWEQRQLITIRIYSVDNWCLSFSFALCPRIFVPNWANGVFRMAVHAFAKCDPLIISSWSPIWPFLPAARNKILSTHFRSFSQVAKHHDSICSCASHQTIIAVSSHKIYSVYNLIRKWKGRKKSYYCQWEWKKDYLTLWVTEKPFWERRQSINIMWSAFKEESGCVILVDLCWRNKIEWPMKNG